VKVLEAVVRDKRRITPDAKIMEEIKGWVEDPIHSRTQDIEFLMIVEAY
jgi:hypothetical protein